MSHLTFVEPFPEDALIHLVYSTDNLLIIKDIVQNVSSSFF